MARYLYGNKLRSYTFDFSKPKVRVTTTENNQSYVSVESKFGLAYCLNSFTPEYINSDAYTYREMKQLLLDKIKLRHFENVTVVE